MPESRMRRVLGSISGGSGALVGAVTLGGVPIAAIIIDMAIGRPSSTAGVGLLFAPVFGGVGALCGAALGGIIRVVAARSGVASTTAPPLALVATSVALSIVIGFVMVLRYERGHAPRIIATTGVIVRLPEGPAPTPLVEAAVVLGSIPIRWRNAPLEVRESGDTLRVLNGAGWVDEIDVSGLGYVARVEGITPRLDGNAEWLALLVSLRGTGLLVVYDPAGSRVHTEVLENTRFGLRSAKFWTAGPPEQRQEIFIELGQSFRYGAR